MVSGFESSVDHGLVIWLNTSQSVSGCYTFSGCICFALLLAANRSHGVLVGGTSDWGL